MEFFDKYKDVFSKDDLDLGQAIDVEHVIDIQGQALINSRPIRRSQSNQAITNEESQKLLSSGILIPSQSTWSYPLLIVKKKWNQYSCH